MLNAIPDRCTENAKIRGLLRANEIFPDDSEDNIIPQQSFALSLRQESSLTLSNRDSTLEILKRNRVIDMNKKISSFLIFKWLCNTVILCINYCSSSKVFGTYYDAINQFDKGRRQVTSSESTAGIFGTLPAPIVVSGLAKVPLCQCACCPGQQCQSQLLVFSIDECNETTCSFEQCYQMYPKKCGLTPGITNVSCNFINKSTNAISNISISLLTNVTSRNVISPIMMAMNILIFFLFKHF
ncbi:unnamed protein product [Rotaria socialis]|uniref:Uncharacterized protein n=1 Tax=Rotaria socialis TaxID=392032 RepID=A0A820J571_9BILA|nr:unnamed protein product [Rotaria socialis]